MRQAPLLRAVALLAALSLASACQTPLLGSASPDPGSGSITTAEERGYGPGGFVPDLLVSHPPYEEIHTSWKQRIDQPYVYFERHGSYAETGAYIATLQREMIAQGLEATGPPFALYYDDPGEVPEDMLRSRIAIPVGGERSPREPLEYDVCESITVAYCYVTGPYHAVPRCYPGVFAFMNRMNWQVAGPIREVYIVPPASAAAESELLTEVQVPVTFRP